MKREKASERKKNEQSLGQYFGKKKKTSFGKRKKGQKVVSWGLPFKGKTKPLRL